MSILTFPERDPQTTERVQRRERFARRVPPPILLLGGIYDAHLEPNARQITFVIWLSTARVSKAEKDGFDRSPEGAENVCELVAVELALECRGERERPRSVCLGRAPRADDGGEYLGEVGDGVEGVRDGDAEGSEAGKVAQVHLGAELYRRVHCGEECEACVSD